MKLKKTLSLFLAGTLMASSLTGLIGCGPTTDPNTEEVDETKTQLYVGYFDGGTGREWLEENKTLFEAQYAKTSFEDGKTGVQIMIDYGKTQYLDGLINDMSTNRQEIYAIGGIKYYDFINRGHLLDITDVVTEGGDNSLENKMNTSLKDYFETEDEKYYAMPLYETFVHMIYDLDMFDKEHLWFAPDGGFVEVDNASMTPGARRAGLSGGVDGWDAGLPETYSEFFLLLEEMVARGITPFTWSGAQVGTYLQYLSTSAWADYQGAEEFAQNFTMDGSVPVRTITSTDFTEAAVGKFSVPSTLISTAMMNKTNAQEIAAKQAGKYYSLKFAHDIMYGKKYVNQARVASPAESHLNAQATYLQSTRTSKKIAMFVEGTWWYHEAKAVFESMGNAYGSQYSSMGRRLGFMPIPKADDGSSAAGRTITAAGDPPVLFVSNYIDEAKIELAKTFLRFINTEEAMRRFTIATKVTRPYDYTLTDEDLAQLPYYSKNLMEVKEDVAIEYMIPRTNDLLPHTKYLGSTAWRFDSRFNVGYGANQMDFSQPFYEYFNYPELTALTWFAGLSTYANIRPYDFTSNG